MKSPRVVITSHHPRQLEIFKAIQLYRFVIAVCGRRFGKTIIGIEQALRDMRQPRFRGWIIAPTRQMVKDLFWEPLKERTERLKWRIDKNESDLVIERLSTHARYTLLSGDRPERLRGRGLNRVIIDEAADMDAKLWPQVIRPALVDRHGDALFTGTPAGRNHFYEMYLKSETLPGWARFQFKTIDNPYIDPAEIEALRQSVDERTFRQEMEADFVEYLGAAYSYYDRDTHCKVYSFHPNIPINVCADFNIDPCIWEIGQSFPPPIDIEYISTEICQRNTTVWRMCTETKSRIIKLLGGDEQRAKGHRLEWYGDFTSAKRRDVTAVASAWGIIETEFRGWNCNYNLKNNPRIVDRLNAMNGLMRSASGKVRFAHHPDCVELGKDYEMCAAGDVLKEVAVGDRTHASDAVGYMVDWKHPILESFARQYTD